MRRRFKTHSAKATERRARKFARKIKRGCIIALEGGLGAGKTVFVKGLAQGLGIEDVVQSPTFVMMNIYPVKRKKIKSLVHVDCYRLDNPHDILNIGLDDHFNDPHAVVVIEWADKVRHILPRKIIRIQFEILGGNDRKITVQPQPWF